MNQSLLIAVGSPVVCIRAGCEFVDLAGEANTAFLGKGMHSGSDISFTQVDAETNLDAAAARSVGDNGPGLSG